MKAYLCFVTVILYTALQAQNLEDCPCQESENNMEFLLNMVSSTDEINLDFTPETSSFYLVETEEEYDYEINIEVDEQRVDAEIEETIVEKIKGIYPLKSYREVMKSKIKMSSKSRKTRNKFKPYKGDCPVFR